MPFLVDLDYVLKVKCRSVPEGLEAGVGGPGKPGHVHSESSARMGRCRLWHSPGLVLGALYQNGAHKFTVMYFSSTALFPLIYRYFYILCI